jgi:hypothetical protein
MLRRARVLRASVELPYSIVMDDRRGGLLAWQFALYPAGHRDRRNLLVHALSVPFFLGGTIAFSAAPLFGPWPAVAGAAAMAAALAAQGRGHRLETQAPVPFRGPLDAIARLVAEQWITFPRFVLSGGFGRAWREGLTGTGV